eukprot:g2361.t1
MDVHHADDAKLDMDVQKSSLNRVNDRVEEDHRDMHRDMHMRHEEQLQFQTGKSLGGTTLLRGSQSMPGTSASLSGRNRTSKQLVPSLQNLDRLARDASLSFLQTPIDADFREKTIGKFAQTFAQTLIRKQEEAGVEIVGSVDEAHDLVSGTKRVRMSASEVVREAQTAEPPALKRMKRMTDGLEVGTFVRDRESGQQVSSTSSRVIGGTDEDEDEGGSRSAAEADSHFHAGRGGGEDGDQTRRTRDSSRKKAEDRSVNYATRSRHRVLDDNRCSSAGSVVVAGASEQLQGSRGAATSVAAVPDGDDQDEEEDDGHSSSSLNVGAPSEDGKGEELRISNNSSRSLPSSNPSLPSSEEGAAGELRANSLKRGPPERDEDNENNVGECAANNAPHDSSLHLVQAPPLQTRNLAPRDGPPSRGSGAAASPHGHLNTSAASSSNSASNRLYASTSFILENGGFTQASRLDDEFAVSDVLDSPVDPEDGEGGLGLGGIAAAAAQERAHAAKKKAVLLTNKVPAGREHFFDPDDVDVSLVSHDPFCSTGMLEPEPGVDAGAAPGGAEAPRPSSFSSAGRSVKGTNSAKRQRKMLASESREGSSVGSKQPAPKNTAPQPAIHSDYTPPPCENKTYIEYVDVSTLAYYVARNTDRRQEQAKAFLQQAIECKGKIPRTYRRPREMGRRYAEGPVSLQSVTRECRAAACGHYLTDVDIVNCYPTILCQLMERDAFKQGVKQFLENVKQTGGATAKKFDRLLRPVEADEHPLSSIRMYGQPAPAACDAASGEAVPEHSLRETCLKEVMRHYAVTREQAKQLFLRLLYSGSIGAWKREVGCENHLLYNHKNEDSKFVRRFAQEAEMCLEVVAMLRQDLAQMFHNAGKPHPKRTALAYVIGEVEDAILGELEEVLSADKYGFGLEVSALCFDGLLVRDKGLDVKKGEEGAGVESQSQPQSGSAGRGAAVASSQQNVDPPSEAGRGGAEAVGASSGGRAAVPAASTANGGVDSGFVGCIPAALLAAEKHIFEKFGYRVRFEMKPMHSLLVESTVMGLGVLQNSNIAPGHQQRLRRGFRFLDSRLAELNHGLRCESLAHFRQLAAVKQAHRAELATKDESWRAYCNQQVQMKEKQARGGVEKAAEEEEKAKDLKKTHVDRSLFERKIRQVVEEANKLIQQKDSDAIRIYNEGLVLKKRLLERCQASEIREKQLEAQKAALEEKIEKQREEQAKHFREWCAARGIEPPREEEEGSAIVASAEGPKTAGGGASSSSGADASARRSADAASTGSGLVSSKSMKKMKTSVAAAVAASQHPEIEAKTNQNSTTESLVEKLRPAAEEQGLSLQEFGEKENAKGVDKHGRELFSQKETGEGGGPKNAGAKKPSMKKESAAEAASSSSTGGGLTGLQLNLNILEEVEENTDKEKEQEDETRPAQTAAARTLSARPNKRKQNTQRLMGDDDSDEEELASERPSSRPAASTAGGMRKVSASAATAEDQQQEVDDQKNKSKKTKVKDTTAKLSISADQHQQHQDKNKTPAGPTTDEAHENKGSKTNNKTKSRKEQEQAQPLPSKGSTSSAASSPGGAKVWTRQNITELKAARCDLDPSSNTFWADLAARVGKSGKFTPKEVEEKVKEIEASENAKAAARRAKLAETAAKKKGAQKKGGKENEKNQNVVDNFGGEDIKLDESGEANTGEDQNGAAEVGGNKGPGASSSTTATESNVKGGSSKTSTEVPASATSAPNTAAASSSSQNKAAPPKPNSRVSKKLIEAASWDKVKNMHISASQIAAAHETVQKAQKGPSTNLLENLDLFNTNSARKDAASPVMDFGELNELIIPDLGIPDFGESHTRKISLGAAMNTSRLSLNDSARKDAQWGGVPSLLTNLDAPKNVNSFKFGGGVAPDGGRRKDGAQGASQQFLSSQRDVGGAKPLNFRGTAEQQQRAREHDEAYQKFLGMADKKREAAKYEGDDFWGPGAADGGFGEGDAETPGGGRYLDSSFLDGMDMEASNSPGNSLLRREAAARRSSAKR